MKVSAAQTGTKSGNILAGAIFLAAGIALLTAPYSVAADGGHTAEKARAGNLQQVQLAPRELYPKTGFHHYASPAGRVPNNAGVRRSAEGQSLSTEAAHELAEQVKETFPKLLRGGKVARANYTSELKGTTVGDGKRLIPQATGGPAVAAPEKATAQEKTAQENAAPQNNNAEKPVPEKSPQAVLSQYMTVPLVLAAFALGAFWSLVGVMMFSKAKRRGTPARQAGASASSRSSEAENTEKLNSARQWMQCALDQAAQAETAASRACVGSKDMRLAAASQAQCHADSARNWAERATQKTYNASSPAQDAAAKARDAANRAQAAADRARYFANSA